MEYKQMLPVFGLAALGLIFVGANAALADGFSGPLGRGMGQPAMTVEAMTAHQAEMFTHQAEWLGLDETIIKEAWAEGKNLQTIAEENGVDLEAIRSEMQAKRQTEMTERIKSLVSAGVITQDQADRRIEMMQSRWQEGGEKVRSEFGEGKGGSRFGFGF